MTLDPFAWLLDLEGVPSAFAGARDGVDAVLRDRGRRRTPPEATAESLLRGAHASAVLAGSESTLEQVRAGEGDDVAHDAVRLSTHVLGLLPTFTSSPLQAIARLHAVAAAGSVPDEELGRPREDGAAHRVRGLANLLGATTSAPAMLVAAVAHADLLATSAFASHNGMVARAVERLVLVSRGVDPASVLVPEAGHLALREEYQAALEAYQRGGTAGMQRWLLHAARACTAGAEASPAVG